MYWQYTREVFEVWSVFVLKCLFCTHFVLPLYRNKSVPISKSWRTFYEIKLKPNKAILIGSSFPSICFISFCLIFNLQLDLLSKMFLSAFCCNFCQILLALIWLGPINLFLFQTLESLIFHPVYTVQVLVRAVNDKSVKLYNHREDPYIGPSPGWKRLLPLSHLRHC